MSACVPQTVARSPPASWTSHSALVSPAPHTTHDLSLGLAMGHEAVADAAERPTFHAMCRAMAEDKAPAKKKARKTAKPALAPRPPSDDAPFGWRTWATVGVVMVGGVIAWKLLGTSYKRDVATICNAEKTSGLSIDTELSKVTAYVRDRLGTPEGNEVYSALGEAKVADRPKKMQDEADKAHVSPCPLVKSFEQMAAQADARSDLQHLCSSVTFPKLIASEDPSRLKMFGIWVDKAAKSPRSKELLAQLEAAPAGPVRAAVLRDAAGKANVFACDNAKTLETPPPPEPTGAPIAKLFSDLQIIAGLREEDVKKSFDAVNPKLVDCYKKGIERKPDLTGKLSVKLEIDPTGKITKDSPGEGNTLPDQETMTCIVHAVRTMSFPPNPGPMASILIPIQLTHADK